MAIAFGTPISSNFGSTVGNSFTLSSLTLATNAYAILQMTVIIKSAVTMPPTAPVWNGQSFTLLANVEDKVADAQSRLLVYGLKATTGATANVTWGLDQFCTVSASVVPVSGQNTTTAIGAVLTQSQWLSAGWAAPTLNVIDSATGDVVYSVLGSPGWDDGYSNLSAVVWTPGAGQSATLFDQNNSAGGSNGYPRVLASTKAGAVGTVNVTYSKNTGSPAYQHVAFAIKAAGASTSLDTLSSPVAVGGTGYSGGTTGIGTATTLTFGGKSATITGTGTNTFTFSMPAFANGVTYPAMGTQTFTVSDASANTGTKTATVAPMSGYTAVIMSGITRGSWSIGKDTNIVDGDEIHLPTSAGTLNADGTLTNYVFGTYTMWRRDVSDGKMYTSTLTVSNGGISISSGRRNYIGIGISTT